MTTEDVAAWNESFKEGSANRILGRSGTAAQAGFADHDSQLDRHWNIGRRVDRFVLALYAIRYTDLSGGPHENSHSGFLVSPARSPSRSLGRRAASRAGRRQDRLRVAADRRPGELRQGQPERRADGHRRVERASANHRRQEGEVRVDGRGRPGRSEDGAAGRAKAGRRQGGRRGRTFQFRRDDSRVEGLQRRRDPGAFGVDQRQVHAAGLQDGVPADGRRRQAREGAGRIRGEDAEVEAARGDRRRHRLRAGARGRVRERR